MGSEKNALQALKASDWHLEAAFDVFYSQPQPRSNAADVRRLEELYNRYKGKLLVVSLLSLSKPRLVSFALEMTCYVLHRPVF